MPEPEDEVERIIAAAIDLPAKGDSVKLARMILEQLWEAGYELTRRTDKIPIRHNPGDNAASPPYTAE